MSIFLENSSTAFFSALESILSSSFTGSAAGFSGAGAAGVALLVGAVTCVTANNTVAIVIAGPIAKECADRFGAVPVRIASVLDTVSCVVQGLIPYGAQILIAIGVAKGLDLQIDSFTLLSHLYYQPILALVVVVAMIFKRKGKINS